MNEAELYEVSLTTRVERLTKLIKLRAQKRIIASEVILVTKAAVGYCGDDYGKALQTSLLKDTRRGFDLCDYCGHELLLLEKHVCGVCLAEAVAEINKEDADDNES